MRVYPSMIVLITNVRATIALNSSSVKVRKGKCWFDTHISATKCKHDDGTVWTSGHGSVVSAPAAIEDGPHHHLARNGAGQYAATKGVGAKGPSTTGTVAARAFDAEPWKLPILEFGGAGRKVGNISVDNGGARARCSMLSCAGVNLLSAIKQDLEPWGNRITREDVEKAVSWKVLQNQFTHLSAKGWNRLTVVGGELYVKNVGQGQGSRDGVFLLVLLELLRRFPDRVPNVDLVLYTEDRARLAKAKFVDSAETTTAAAAAKKNGGGGGSGGGGWGKREKQRKALPFALGFARHRDYLDVAVPDPSFFGWPEMGVNPHWHLASSLVAQTPWAEKADAVHWRGGMRRSGKLREALVACAKNRAHVVKATSQGQGTGAAASTTKARGRSAGQELQRGWVDVLPRTSANWEHPLAMGKHKLALFIQGEGYTSSKQRTLASGSCPVFAELSGHDTYFGRWLEEGVHFKRVRVDDATADTATALTSKEVKTKKKCVGGNACASCGDLEAIARWAFDHPPQPQPASGAAAVAADVHGVGERGVVGGGGGGGGGGGAAWACAQAARAFSDDLFSRRMLLEYTLTVLEEVAKRQQAGPGYDYEAVVREVHGGGGSSGSDGSGGGGVGGEAAAGAGAVTEESALAVLESACGHQEAKGDCAEAARLVKWWLSLGPEEYAGLAEPPCRKDLCARCCSKVEKKVTELVP